MLPESIQLIVVTPERQLLRESVVEVTVPGLDGQLGILPGHAPLMTELGIGELSYRTNTSSRPIVLAVISGFAEVLPDRVIVLADAAERAAEIDAARARNALAGAEKAAASSAGAELEAAQLAAGRARTRLEVAAPAGAHAEAHH